MSFRINNNIAAIDAHRNLTLTTRELSNSMEKMSSGFRINRAADDPAGLVISEQFRAQIAGLNQAIENSEGSINMIQTAEGALTEINSLLISMRELAIHAANEGFNDDDQLAADQAEIENAVATINRIAQNTQFGTKLLLDGSNDNVANFTSDNDSDISIVQSSMSTGQHTLNVSQYSAATSSIDTTAYGLSLDGTGTPYNLASDTYTIDIIQASDQAEKISSDITLADSGSLLDAFSNGITLAAAATSAQIVDTTGFTAGVGTINFDLIYQYNGGATVSGTFAVETATADALAGTIIKINSAINANSDLQGKVEAYDDGGNLGFRTTDVGAEYSFKLDNVVDEGGVVSTDQSGAAARGSSLNELEFTVKSAASLSGAQATVTLTAATYTTLTALSNEIQSQLETSFGTTGTLGNLNVEIVSGQDQLRFYTADEGSEASILTHSITDAGNLMDLLNLTADQTEITGTDAVVTFDSYANNISLVEFGNTGTITLANLAGTSTTVGRGTIDMVVGEAHNGIDTGTINLTVEASTYDVQLDLGTTVRVTAGIDTMVYNADRTESAKLNLSLTAPAGSRTETLQVTDNSLIFQIGANVGQTAKIAIMNMAASNLGKSIAGNMFNSLSDISVTTARGAQDAQVLIDAAIDEVSTVRGTLGSFQKNSLESNLSNLRIASQNLTSAESSIRDTDMASEMSNFTKNQILLQAGTAMLAQANQVPQVILSLFG